MENVGFIILIIIGIIIFVAILGLLIYNNSSTVIIGTSTGLANSDHCTPNLSTLPDLSSDLCCVIFGELTSNKYLSSLNLVVSLEPSPYLDVCAGFCTEGYSSSLGTCIGDIASDIGQFNQCVSAIKPVNCSDESNPVASSNGQYMYGNTATLVLCPTQTNCAVQL
jgi:hypothetical protein